MSGEPYDLRLSGAACRALTDQLKPSVAFAAWEFCDGPLRDNPHRVGRPLEAPFAGCWAARRGSYRVRYEIDDDKHLVTVLDIAGRADAYYAGRA